MSATIKIQVAGMKSTVELLNALNELREEVAGGALTNLEEIEARLDLILRMWGEVTG